MRTVDSDVVVILFGKLSYFLNFIVLRDVTLHQHSMEMENELYGKHGSRIPLLLTLSVI